MKRFLPDMYNKSIFDIDYKFLKSKGIKCLVFDLDNTIALIDENITPEKTKKLFDKLKKDFKVIIISNNFKKRVEYYSKQLGVDFISFAMKPSIKGLTQIKLKYKYKKSDMCMIGDQIMTDVLSGNIFGVYTILVDPLGEKDLKITKFNRYLEGKVLIKLNNKYQFEKGKYYGK